MKIFLSNYYNYKYKYFRCASCYHTETFQRAKHILELPNVSIVHVAYSKTDVTVKCKFIIVKKSMVMNDITFRIYNLEESKRG